MGIDISDDSIHFMELKQKGSHFKIGHYGLEKLPNGVVEDGFIRDNQKLVAALSKIKSSTGTRLVKASLPEEKSYLFRTTLPMMKDEEIHSALRFKIEENVPLALSEAVFDHCIIGSDSSEKNLDLSVTVVHKKVVEGYLEALKSAGFSPLELQIESQAMSHAAVPYEDKGVHIVVSMRETKTVLSIVSAGEVQFTSTIHLGNKEIFSALKKNLNMQNDQVENIIEGKENQNGNDIFLSLVSALSALRDEIEKLVIFWTEHWKDYGGAEAVDSIIVSGGDSLLDFDNYFSRSLNIKTVVADPWNNVFNVKDAVPELSLREALDYLPAIGLALPYE